MSKKRISIFSGFLLLFCGLIFINCTSDMNATPESEIIEKDVSNVTLKLNYQSIPLLDSLVLDCYGADTIHLVKNANEKQFDLNLFPHEHWIFKAKIYANGNLIQIGEIESRIEAGKTTTLSIQMHALIGFVYLKIPLGFGNPINITYGELKLSSEKGVASYPMKVNGNNAIFKTDVLPLNMQYDINLILYNNLDQSVYQLQDSFYLSEEMPIPSLQIKSLQGKADLSLSLAENVNLQFTLNLPASKRYPRKNDIVITEFLSSPLKSDSSQYEFIEIYNGSIDTLLLSECSLGTSTAAGKLWSVIPEYILPGEIMVFGDTSSNTPPEYQNTVNWSDLTNTKSSIVFVCNNEILDSLYYSNAPESETIILNNSSTLKNPISSQLRVNLWENRVFADSWCQASPTPGKEFICE